MKPLQASGHLQGAHGPAHGGSGAPGHPVGGGAVPGAPPQAGVGHPGGQKSLGRGAHVRHDLELLDQSGGLVRLEHVRTKAGHDVLELLPDLPHALEHMYEASSG
jgi:hypothetical protein